MTKKKSRAYWKREAKRLQCKSLVYEGWLDSLRKELDERQYQLDEIRRIYTEWQERPNNAICWYHTAMCEIGDMLAYRELAVSAPEPSDQERDDGVRVMEEK